MAHGRTIVKCFAIRFCDRRPPNAQKLLTAARPVEACGLFYRNVDSFFIVSADRHASYWRSAYRGVLFINANKTFNHHIRQRPVKVSHSDKILSLSIASDSEMVFYGKDHQAIKGRNKSGSEMSNVECGALSKLNEHLIWFIKTRVQREHISPSALFSNAILPHCLHRLSAICSHHPSW